MDDVSNRVQNSEPNAVFLVDGLRNSDALSLLTQAIEMVRKFSKIHTFRILFHESFSINLGQLLRVNIVSCHGAQRVGSGHEKKVEVH